MFTKAMQAALLRRPGLPYRCFANADGASSAVSTDVRVMGPKNRRNYHTNGHLTRIHTHDRTDLSGNLAQPKKLDPSAALRTHVRSCHTNARCQKLEELYQGNHEFRNFISTNNPGLLSTLANEGQRPPFMMLDCSDSRVSEQAIFNAKPGTIFTTGNIANQFHEEDLTSNSVLAYAVDVLKVKHVVIMGHYGCGGVAASMGPPPEPPLTPGDAAVQEWITPIRKIFRASTRPEIIAYRNKLASGGNAGVPHHRDAGFRALVEENVKETVKRVVTSAVISRHYGMYLSQENKARNEDITKCVEPGSALGPVFIHGWVYDVETGEVADLDVSVGPPGLALPKSPFPVVNTPSAQYMMDVRQKGVPFSLNDTGAARTGRARA